MFLPEYARFKVRPASVYEKVLPQDYDESGLKMFITGHEIKNGKNIETVPQVLLPDASKIARKYRGKSKK